LVTAGVAATVLALVGAAATRAEPPTAADAATLGTTHISKTRFDATMRRLRAGLKTQGQRLPKQGTSEYESERSQAIWFLILEAARKREAAKLGIKVTAAQVTSRLDQLRSGPPFNGDAATFQHELEKEGYTLAELRIQLEAAIVSEQLKARIGKDVTATSREVHAYFVAHKADYPPTRKVQYILVGKGKQALANRIYHQLRAGADFTALAKKHSQDPSAKNGGGVLFATKGQTVPDFDRIAFSLKTGGLARFNTPEYGWFVVKALEPVKTTNERDAASSIRSQLLATKRDKAFTTWSNRLAQRICTGGTISYAIGYLPDPDPCAQYR
jgi:parvulin-like peptidyl-prolyl isomerase